MNWIRKKLFKWKIVNYFRFKKFCREYKKSNKHNYTFPENFFSLSKVEIGNNTYGPVKIIDFGLEEEKIKIGSFCSIASEVTFLLSGEHNYKTVSTYPYHSIIINDKENTICRGPIIIEDDVWIGYGCIILSGVKIGKGAVIGAGTVVAKDVPPYSIFVNGKVIKYRFEKNIIDELMKIDYSKFDKKFIEDNITLLDSKISVDVVKKLIERQSEKDER